MSTADDLPVAGAIDPAGRLVGPTRWLYESTMIALAVVVVATLPLESRGWVRVTNIAIWMVFVVDYLVRLALSSDRRRFVASRWIDLVAILPLDLLRAARVLRLARLVRALRAGAVLWRLSENFRGVLATNGLGAVLLVSASVVLLGTIGIWALEPGIDDLGDALWWAVVTTTTVGYGDLSPATGAGRALAAVLMLVGIGTIGMITGSIATYFLERHGVRLPSHVAFARAELGRWHELSSLERDRVADMVRALADEPEART